MMANSITIELLGAPVPFARTRRSFTTGHPINPPKQQNAAAAFRLVAQTAMIGRSRFEGPITVRMTAVFEVPASWSKKKRQAALANIIRPNGRPDIDNIYKLCADAANGIVWRDDALVVNALLAKIYGHQAKVVLTVSALEQQA